MAIKHVKVVCDTAFPDCACKEVGTSEWNDSHTIEAATSFCSPIFVTPALGVPASGVATNITGLPTAGILDNAVTLGKMAGITAGNLITGDACGDPAAVATGTACQVLTSNGACLAPTFQAAGGGGGFCVVFKSADQAICTDITLTDDCCLQFAVDACSTYSIYHNMAFKTQDTPDFKYSYSVPACTTGRRINGNWAGGPFEVTTTCWTTSMSPTVVGTAAFFIVHTGYITTSTTAGTFAFQWAQNTSSATCTTLVQGDWMMFRKLN